MAEQTQKYTKTFKQTFGEAHGLWLSRNGTNYTGEIEIERPDGSFIKQRVIMFKNKYKKDGDKQPDFHLHLPPKQNA